MKRFLSVLVLLALVGGSSGAWASCGWFGTQMQCTFGGRELSIGTQAAAEPTHAGALGPLALHGGDRSFGARPVGRWPLRLEIQNVGTDAGLCWRFGDETYCH